MFLEWWPASAGIAAVVTTPSEPAQVLQKRLFPCLLTLRNEDNGPGRRMFQIPHIYTCTAKSAWFRKVWKGGHLDDCHLSNFEARNSKLSFLLTCVPVCAVLSFVRLLLPFPHSTSWELRARRTNKVLVSWTTWNHLIHRWTFTFGEVVNMVVLGWVVMKGKRFEFLYHSFLNWMNESKDYSISNQSTTYEAMLWTNLADYIYWRQARMDPNRMRRKSHSWTYQERRSILMGLELLWSIRARWQWNNQESSHEALMG